LSAELALWLLAGLLVVLGIAGLVLPGLPGAPLLFAGLFAGAWAEDFRHFGWGWLSVFFVMALATWGVDFVATSLGARRFGASRRAVLGALLGTIGGFLVGGLVGVVLGPLVGAVLGELSAGRDFASAQRAGLGAALGLAVGAAAKLALSFSMLALFAAVRWL
jgi:uncharacterized protein YqgC (DUF456 family)